MKIGRGDNFVDLPPIGELASVVYVCQNIHYRLAFLPLNELERLRVDGLSATTRYGFPAFCALGKDNTLQFFPSSDSDGQLLIRYFPPMLEI